MRSVALGGVAAVLAVGSGCIRYTPYCENGVSPFDGQSAVPLDGGVTFTVKGPLADDLPPLDDAITFETRSGRRVPSITRGPAVRTCGCGWGWWAWVGGR